MAGPQFIKPKPVTPSRPKRRFTLAQANSTLPLVRRIASDVVTNHARALQIQADLPLATGKMQTSLQQELELTMHHLEDFADELSEIGCDLKDYATGLIDFTGRHAGHDVCLCWRVGEEAIYYWHEIDAGFAGRQPVSVLREKD